MTDPAHTTRTGSRSWLVAAPVSAVAAVGVWLAWLGWRTPYVVTSGETTGPWTHHEVTGLVLTWAVVVAIGCWRAEALPVVTGAVLGLTAVYVADLGFRPQDVDDGQRGLIVIGASWVVCAAAGGGGLVALVVAGVRSVVDRARARRERR